MKLQGIALTIIVAAMSANTAVAQVARPGDKTVKELIEKVQKTTRGFQKALDSEVRNGTLRGASGEVNVERYFDDWNTDMERLAERFKAKYSASAEAQTVLRKGTDVDRFIHSQPPALKGRSEWDVAAASLKELAEAYGTTFPLPADGSPRRINDQEVEEAADAIADSASSYRKGLKDAFPKEEKAALETAQGNVDALEKAAKNLRSRVDSGKPASGEAGVVAESYAAVKKAVGDRKLPESAVGSWNTITKSNDKIAQAFSAGPAAAAQPTPAKEKPAAEEKAPVEEKPAEPAAADSASSG
jgi:hypothetical protein